MKKYAGLTVVGVALALCTGTLHAQETETSPGTRVGIGVALERTLLFGDEGDLAFLPVGLSNIYVPIVMASGFRIEPEIGYLRLSESGDDWKSSGSSMRFGLGILPAVRRGNTSIYFGARLGLVYTKTSFEFTGSESRSESKTDYYVGAAVGAEYGFSTHFTVGAEVQVNYISVGDFAEESDGSHSLIGNRNLVFLRWYF